MRKMQAEMQGRSVRYISRRKNAEIGGTCSAFLAVDVSRQSPANRRIAGFSYCTSLPLRTSQRYELNVSLVLPLGAPKHAPKWRKARQKRRSFGKQTNGDGYGNN